MGKVVRIEHRLLSFLRGIPKRVRDIYAFIPRRIITVIVYASCIISMRLMYVIT